LIELAASILSADFFSVLGEQVHRRRRRRPVVSFMWTSWDGHFVPNLTIGPPVVKSLRKVTKLPLDCHLMIENADEFYSGVCRRWRGLDFGAPGSVPALESHAASHQEP